MRGARAAAAATAAPAALSPWLRIGPDGAITVFVEKCEMGPGAHTALALLAAEELDVEWRDVRVEMLPLEGAERWPATGASSSVRESFAPLRAAGAAAREMLVAGPGPIAPAVANARVAATGRASRVMPLDPRAQPPA